MSLGDFLKYIFSKKNEGTKQNKRLILLLVAFLLIVFIVILFVLDKDKNIEAGSTPSISTVTSTLSDNFLLNSDISTNSVHSNTVPSEISKESSISKVSKAPISSQSSSVIKKQYVLNPEQVLSLTVNSIKALDTKTTYSKNISNPAVRELLVDTELSNEDISNYIYNLILDTLYYDAYLEFLKHPLESQPIPFDYLYNVQYIGKTDDGTQHKFAFSYRLNKQSYAIENFDTDEVIKNVKAEINLQSMDGLSQSKFSKSINIVKTFYSTSQAVEALVNHIEITITGENNNAAVDYTQFDIIYYGKNDTEYTFILLLG